MHIYDMVTARVQQHKLNATNEKYYIFQVANRDIPLQMYSDVVPNSDCPPTMLLRYIICATPTLKWELHRIHTEFGFMQLKTGKDNTAR